VTPPKSTDILFKKRRRLRMKKESTGSISIPSNKKVYIGIDVHKESWHVTARTEGEELIVLLSNTIYENTGTIGS
jgi:hypothetical protein